MDLFKDPLCIGFTGRGVEEMSFCSFGSSTATVIDSWTQYVASYQGNWNGGAGPARSGLTISGSGQLPVDWFKRIDIAKEIGDIHPIQTCSLKSPTVVAENT